MSRIYEKSIYGADIEQLVQCSEQVYRDINVYIGIKQKLASCKNDDEIVALITSPDFFEGVQYKVANNIKHSILSSIRSHDLRIKIINSMENSVSPELAELSTVAQTIILNFFEKAYNGEIPEDKMEKILLVLKKNDVQLKAFKHFLGLCESENNIVSIRKSEFNIGNIATLIHEYYHAMSGVENLFDPVYYNEMSDIEEGLADTFSDMALNMYISQHPEFLKRLGIEGEQYRYVSRSCYHSENSIVRTLLYPLEKEHNDLKAISEYALGQKNEFFKMVLPEDVIDDMPRNESGICIFDTRIIGIEQLYKINRGKYLNLNRESMYCAKNNIIGKFEKYDRQAVIPDFDDRSIEKGKWKVFREDDDDEVGVKPSFYVWQDRFEEWYGIASKMPEGVRQKQEIVEVIKELETEQGNQIDEQR